MAKKCGIYNCNEDFVSYDDLDNKCVAFQDYHCINCSTIQNFLKEPRNKLGKDPIKKLFALNVNPEKEQEFLESIKTTCTDIKLQNNNQTPKFYIAGPDYQQLEQDHTLIIQKLNEYKIENKLKNFINADKFINTLYTIANSPKTLSSTLKDQPDPAFFYKQWIKELLQHDGCSSLFTHEVQELPINIQFFFNKLLTVKQTKFNSLIQFLETKPQVCLEGAIEVMISKYLDTKNNSKTASKTKSTKKSKKYKKTLKSKRTQKKYKKIKSTKK
jgi:hypothetical protein